MLYAKIGIVVIVNFIFILAEVFIMNVTFPIILKVGYYKPEQLIIIFSLLAFGSICLANVYLYKTGTYKTAFNAMLKNGE